MLFYVKITIFKCKRLHVRIEMFMRCNKNTHAKWENFEISFDMHTQKHIVVECRNRCVSYATSKRNVDLQAHTGRTCD